MQKSLQNRNIVLFGGAFDPPHVGHALAIRQILDTQRFDQVWVTPTGERPDKVAQANASDRLVMVSRMIQEIFPDEPVVVADYLIFGSKPLPTTIEELSYLSEVYPNTVFSVAIGRDQAEALAQWNRSDELIATARFLILVRDGRTVQIPQGLRAHMINPHTAAWMTISSTDIRNRRRDKRKVSGMLTPSVAEYIQKTGLYAPSRKDLP